LVRGPPGHTRKSHKFKHFGSVFVEDAGVATPCVESRWHAAFAAHLAHEDGDKAGGMPGPKKFL